MITKHEILDQLNKLIVNEKGRPVTMDSLFADAELDSLGTILVLAELDADYRIFPPEKVENEIANLLENLTVRGLIVKCKLSTTGTSTAQKIEKTT